MQQTIVALLLLAASSLIAADKARLCTEVCWTHHIGDDSCPIRCIASPSPTEYEAQQCHDCITKCAVNHFTEGSTGTYADCRGRCFDQYFPEFTRSKTRQARRATNRRSKQKSSKIPGVYASGDIRYPVSDEACGAMCQPAKADRSLDIRTVDVDNEGCFYSCLNNPLNEAPKTQVCKDWCEKTCAQCT